MQARVSLAAAAFLVLAWMLASLAHGQDYPLHPIKLVLPQPPGGIIDLISRSLGERLSEQMKQPVIVENMPGANGSLAAGQVVRSVPDGYTLFMAVDTNLVVNPNLYTNLAYDPFRDFAPISVLAKVPLVLVANPKVPANDVRELIAFAKAHPGTLNYASIGLGTQSHPNRLPIREFDPQRFQSPHHFVDDIKATCEGFRPPPFHGAYRIEVDAAPLSEFALRQASEHASCPQLISRL